MDAENIKDELAKLDELRIAHARTSARVEYLESDLRDHRTHVSKSLADLQLKVDALHDRFNAVSSDVKVLALRISLLAIGSGIGVQVLLRKIGLL